MKLKGLLAAVAAVTAGIAGATDWISAKDAAEPSEAVKKSFLAPEGTSRFRREVTNAAAVSNATLRVSGLGVFRVWVNGRAVGDEVLRPGFTHAEKTKYFFTYDVSALLDRAAGARNVVEAEVSTGWWNDRITGYRGRRSALWAELELVGTDGAKRVVGTDPSWSAAVTGPVVRAGIFDGEIYDARRRVDPKAFAPAVVNREFAGELLPNRGGAVYRRTDLTLAPAEAYVWKDAEGADATSFGRVVKLRTYPKGAKELTLAPGERLVVDFAQNAAAVPEFTAKAAAGTVLTILPGETLNDANGDRRRGCDGPEGSVYRANLRDLSARGARVEYTFAGGGEETYSPSYTFFGYRYATLTASAPVTLERLVSVPVTSITKEMEIGEMETSDPAVNRLIENVRWSQYANYLSVPTDCPQRDERQGWTADAQVFSLAGSYNADTYGFLDKFMRDMTDTQTASGEFPSVAPVGQYDAGGYGRFGWGDAGVIIPYNLWRQTGRTEIIDRHWPAMVRFMKWVDKTSHEENGEAKFQFADWLSYEDFESFSQAYKDGKGEVCKSARYLWTFLARCYAIMNARMMAEMAAATGRVREVEPYRALERFVRWKVGCSLWNSRLPPELQHMQTPALFALHCGILKEPKMIEATRAGLLWNIRAHGNRLQTGFLGTSILMDTLTYDLDATAVAYSLLLQRENPSWLYSVDQGATTIWERWNGYRRDGGFGDCSMNSFNHYAYGGPALAWLYGAAAGIRHGEKAGWDEFVLEPRPDPRLKMVCGDVKTPKGRIVSGWTYDERGRCVWSYEVPEGTRALVRVNGTENLRGPGGYTEIIDTPETERIVQACCTSERFYPGSRFGYHCWAPKGLKDGEGGVFVLLERDPERLVPTLARLMSTREIPPAICIFLPSGVLTAPTEKAASRWMRPAHLDQPGTDFPNLIVEDVLPHVEATLGVRAARDPNRNFICGSSSGGIAAFNACWYRNDFFRRCACFSPTFSNVRGGNEILPLVRKYEPRPIRVWLTAGTDEPDHFFGDSYVVAEEAASALRYAGYSVRYDRVPNGRHGVKSMDGAYYEQVLPWLFRDWSWKDVTPRSMPFRVREVVAWNPTWKRSDFRMPAPVREVISSDRWRVYSTDPTSRFVWSDRLNADGSRDQRHKLVPLEYDWNVSRPGGSALAVSKDNRLFVATELGVQSVVTAGIVDAILPLPGFVPCDNVALVDDILYASSGTNVFARRVQERAPKGTAPVRPETPHYWDGRMREHEPAGGLGEFLGSGYVAKHFLGAQSVVRDAAGKVRHLFVIGNTLEKGNPPVTAETPCVVGSLTNAFTVAALRKGVAPDVLRRDGDWLCYRTYDAEQRVNLATGESRFLRLYQINPENIDWYRTEWLYELEKEIGK